MKIIASDFKKGSVKIRVSSPEDAWHLSQLIEAGDVVRGRTVRKITIGAVEGRTARVQKPVTLAVAVERAEVAAQGLRVSGKVTAGPEDVPRGSYHTITLEEGQEYTLSKEEWLPYHRLQLKEAVEAAPTVLLLCVFDRDEALIAASRAHGIEILTRLQGDLPKKEERASARADFYGTIIRALQQYAERLKPSSVILASPGFYQEDLARQINDPALKEKLVLATCSSARERALDEVLKRPETRSALQHVRVAQETALVERLLDALARNERGTYGFAQVQRAAAAGAVQDMLVTNQFIADARARKSFKEVNDLFRLVEQGRGDIHLIGSLHDAGRQLQGLGGIAALLRYHLPWL